MAIEAVIAMVSLAVLIGFVVRGVRGGVSSSGRSDGDTGAGSWTGGDCDGGGGGSD